MLQTAVTGLRTVPSKSTRFALLIASFSGPTCRASTLTIDRITNSIIRAVASLRAILSKAVGITGTVAPNSLPSRSAKTLTRFRCTRGSIHTLTALAAILTVGPVTALLLTVFAVITGNTIASSVDMIARRIILAIAVNQAILSISQEWTWSVAQRATPTRIAVAFSSPWVAHLGVVPIAFALTRAVLAESVVRTYPQPTVRSHPTSRTRTLASGRVANGSVQTPTLFRAVVPVGVVRTRIQALRSHKSGGADTFPSHVIAIGTVEAFTLLLAPQTVSLALATISTYRSGITGRTNTLTRLRIATSPVLAATIRSTLLPVLTLRTPLGTQRSSESGCAITFPGNRIALAPVLALAHLGTVLAEAIRWTLVLAVVPTVALLAGAASVLSFARGVVLALAQLAAVGSPSVWRAIYVAYLPGVSLVAFASLRCYAHSMFAPIAARRNAPVSLLIFLVPGTALLQYPLLGYTRSFVHNLRFHSIRRTPGRHCNAPLLISLLIRNFPGSCHKELILFHLFAHIWPVQLIVDHHLIHLHCGR